MTIHTTTPTGRRTRLNRRDDVPCPASGHGRGLRKTTPESLAAGAHARRWREGRGPAVTRTAALAVAKRAAAALGLKAAKIALIDQLFACSRAVDWTTPGVAPVVWPSNARLARSLGISVSTMKHHLNGLVRAGLVAYSDGPTYQRGGRRDDEGRIVEGAGIDLSPIAARYDELSELAERTEAEARARDRANRRRTVLRKAVQSLLLSALERGTPGPWHEAQARLDALVEARPADLDALRAVVDALEALSDELEQAYLAAEDDRNFNTALAKFRPTTSTAEGSDSETVDQRTRADARESRSDGAAGAEAAKTKRGGAGVAHDSRLAGVTLPMVRQACPDIAAIAPASLESWSDFREAGRMLCAAAGINPQVWHEARDVLGPDLAAAAVAVTVQRCTAGTVAKPGAYLRTLVQRGRDGRLHIGRSLQAMARGGGGADAPEGHAAGSSGAGQGAREPAASTGERFPASGTIRWHRLAELIRAEAPRPTPDPDVVAEAFRRHLRERGLDPMGGDVDRLLAGFCRRWRR